MLRRWILSESFYRYCLLEKRKRWFMLLFFIKYRAKNVCFFFCFFTAVALFESEKSGDFYTRWRTEEGEGCKNHIE